MQADSARLLEAATSGPEPDRRPTIIGRGGQVFSDERLVAGAGPSVGLPSGSVTFLLTDVVGSTRIWENAPDVMLSSLERHDRIVQAAVEANGGVFVKAKGEG